MTSVVENIADVMYMQWRRQKGGRGHHATPCASVVVVDVLVVVFVSHCGYNCHTK